MLLIWMKEPVPDSVKLELNQQERLAMSIESCKLSRTKPIIQMMNLPIFRERLMMQMRRSWQAISRSWIFKNNLFNSSNLREYPPLSRQFNNSLKLHSSRMSKLKLLRLWMTLQFKTSIRSWMKMMKPQICDDSFKILTNI